MPRVRIPRNTPNHVEEPQPEHLSRWAFRGRRRSLRRAFLGLSDTKWSPKLLSLLLEELHVTDDVEELLGVSIPTISDRQVPTAVVAALLIRHSWRVDDLAQMARRLRLGAPKRRSARSSMR